jgi:hypothetical protein
VKARRASVTVNRPIREVFDFLAEGRNNSMWRSDVSMVARISSSGLGVGTTFFQKVLDGRGGTVDETYQITRYEPPNLVEFSVARGSTRTIGCYTLVRVDGDTTHVEFALWRVSPEFRTSARHQTNDQLQRRVDSITEVPAAMRDEEARPL